MSFLNKFSDLANAISGFQSRDKAANNNSTQSKPADRESSPTPDGSHRYEDASDANHGTGEKGGDGEPNRQIEDKIKQAEELVRLFHAAITSLRESSSGYQDALLDGDNPQAKAEGATNAAASAELTALSQSTSTSSLDLHFLPSDMFAELNEQDNSGSREHRESVSHGGNSNRRGASRGSVVMIHPALTTSDGGRRLSSMASPPDSATASSGRKETQHNGDFDLDETRWNAELNAIQLNESESTQMRDAELLSELLASSRDTKKKFAWLKQFISDAYDTIVGKLKELPLRSLQRFVRARCSLAMSTDEWHDHHHHQRRSHGGSVGVSPLGVPNDPVTASLASISLAEIIHEHFHCQSGLKHLVASALANLTTCLDNFKAIDPDVNRFHTFMNLEKSHDELLFFCVCRLFASQGSDNGGVFSVASGSPTAAAAERHQPAFHPETMRELIELPQALRVAKSLFRVDDEAAIQNADAGLVEIENAVYKRYQPSSAYSQFEAVLSGYYLTVAPQAHGRQSADPADYYEEGLGLDPSKDSQCTRRPPVASSPRLLANLPPGSMVRPSNVNQFHSKQFHAVAARSPLVRRHHQKPPVPGPYRTGGGDALVEAKWVHFDDFVDLLVKYRSEMSHFHLFTRWARELYSTATATSAMGFSTALDYPGAPRPPPQLLSDALFVDALLPYSLGPMERELTNIFHNALKQRNLQQWMPPRVFASVVLLMLRNGLLSVSNFRPQARSSSARTPGQSKNQSIRGQNEDKRWMRLALKWRTQEVEFERALEAIYESSGGDPTAAATRLLELRNELYKLFISSSGSENLQRAKELCDRIALGLAHAKGQGRIGITRTFNYDDDSDDEAGAWGDSSSASGEVAARSDRNHPEEPGEGSAWETGSTA